MNRFARCSARAGLFVGLVGVSLVGGLGPSRVHAQGSEGRWQAHTSMREVVDLAVSPGAVWAATSGGVFRYIQADGELRAFTASEGLHSVSTRAVTYDAVRDLVWIGYEDGVLDRLDPNSGAVQSYLDIARAERFPARQIHRLVVHGDSLLVATAFGLVVFDPVRGEVRDTYSRLGNLAAATAVYDVAVAPTPEGPRGLWLATGDGVAYASLTTANLQDPQAWTIVAAGLPSREVLSIAAFRGTIYAGTAAGLAVLGDDRAFHNTGLTTYPVGDLTETPAFLLGTDRFGLLSVDAAGATRWLSVPGFQDPTSVTGGPGGTLWLADRQGGLLSIEVPPPPATQAAVLQSGVYPEGPFHSDFGDLVVAPSGDLWAAGTINAGLGFYRMDVEGQWTDYVPGRVPELGGRNSFEVVHVDARGDAWAGSAGNALVQVTREGEIIPYNQTNSSLLAPPGQPASFIFVGGIDSDEDGNLWVTNRASPVPLHVRTPDDEWTPLSGFTCSGYSASTATFDQLTIDSFGQKWIVVRSRTNLRQSLGLLVLDTRATPTTAQDDLCRFFSRRGSGGQDLPGTDITSVVEDRDGTIWIGTGEGLAFVINNGIVAHDESVVPVWPQYADRSQGTFLFYGARINDLAVDPANQLWVATDQGVHLVRGVAGGYEIVQSFTSANSPLFADNVIAVAVSPRTGEVFFATEQGLISYEGDAVAPVEQAGDLLVYPNPIRIADGAVPDIFIDGLVDASELRIVAPHGALVARLSARGGRIRWDGRDTAGRLVPSGVYLVIAVGQNGGGTAYGKVAVVR